MKPAVSIIIISFNTKKLVLDCISSIKENGPAGVQIIVVDNNSSDGSAQALKLLERKNKNIKVILNDENSGFSKANNQGIKIADGDYILLLNSDTIVKKGAIEKLVNFAEVNADAGVVGPKLINRDGTNQASCYRLPTLKNAFLEFWFGKKGLTDKFTPATNQPIEVEAIVGAAFLITPRARKEVGLLDERYFFYFEDLDYCRRVKKVGLKTYYIPDAQITHLLGESGKKLAEPENQWRRLIPSSKVYHGLFKHYLLTSIIWISQKARLHKDLASLIIIVVSIIPTFTILFRPGFFSMQDDLQAFRVYEMDRCFDDFQLPCRWVPDAGYRYGYPQFIYYPPSIYYLGAILHRIGFQYIDSVKILFILGYIISAFAMYFLVKAILGRWPGYVSAILYTYVPYKAVEVYVRGALNEFWTLAFFPIIFWSSYKLIKSNKIKYLLWLSVSLALLITTHALMTMIFVPVLILWVIFWSWGKWKGKLLVRLATAGLIGVGLSSFYLLPLMVERKFAHLESLLSGYFDYRQHFVSLYKIFIDMRWGYGSSGFPKEILNLSTGIAQWILGALAIILAILYYKKHKTLAHLTLFLGGIELVTLFMMHMKSSFIWAALSPLVWLQFPWRFLSISIFLLAILAGLAVYMVQKKAIIVGLLAISISIILSLGFFHPKDWLNITDKEKFSGASWEKQLTISIFDYLPIYAKLPPITEAQPEPEVLEGKIDIVNYKKGSNFQTGVVNVEENSLIRIPLFDFPGMKVLIDGDKTVHWNDDCRNQPFCYGLITFQIPKGRHTIEARLTKTPSRIAGDVISLISIGAAVFLASKKNAQKLFS